MFGPQSKNERYMYILHSKRDLHIGSGIGGWHWSSVMHMSLACPRHWPQAYQRDCKILYMEQS